jgi:diaminopimelate epimerase
VTRFYKLSGAGNDFLALAEPAAVPGEAEIRAWCRRGVSLGADGLFVLRRSSGASGGLDMCYWNADGLPADLCLNGTRCAAQLAFHLGWAEGGTTVATPAGSFRARRLDATRVELQVPAPLASDTTPREMVFEVAGERVTAWFLPVGVPHLVLPWPAGLEGAPVVALGRPLRSAPELGPAGANVNFVRFSPSGRPDRMEIRTFERGVEDETLACGTGVLAGAAVGLHLGAARLPLSVLTQGGFELAVGQGGEGWTFAGDARLIAEGDLHAATAGGPPPARWSAGL